MRCAPVIVALLLAQAGPAVADIWKGVDKDGNVLYSDEPIPGGTRIHREPVQTIAPPRPRAPATPPRQAPGVSYEVVEVLLPDQDATVRDNQGRVEVNVALTPNLRVELGHRVLVLLDGSPRGEPATTTRLEISDVERGTHTLEVRVLAADGSLLARSDPVTFHMHRTALGGTAR